MFLQSHKFMDSSYNDQHLQINFGKNSFNTTTASRTPTIDQSIQLSQREPADQTVTKFNSILIIQEEKMKPVKKEPGLNKNSRCFHKEISKVLKKNKIKNSTEPNQNMQPKQNKSYFQFDTEASAIHCKEKAFLKATKNNAEIKKVIFDNNFTTKTFNFQQFLESSIHKKQAENKLKFKENKQPVKNRTHKKNKTVFICDLGKNQNHDVSYVKEQKSFHNKKTSILHNQEAFVLDCFPTSNHTTQNILIQSERVSFKNQSRFSMQSMKSSRAQSIKQSRRIEVQKKNKLENSQLRKTLKRALSNLSVKSQNNDPCKAKSLKKQPDGIIEEEPEKPLNYAQRIQNIHFDKIRSKVMSKMQQYKKIKEIRESEEKLSETHQKKRTSSAQPKKMQTVEETNLTIKKQEPQPNNFKNKDFKHRRPYTALSRTGLEYDRRDQYKRRSSDRQDKIVFLTGLHNSANQYRTYSKNAARQIEELNECKSDRVVRQLQEKYATRPQTAKAKKSAQRPSTARINRSSRDSELAIEKMIQNLPYEKVTKRQIQKEKMKEKLLGLMVECEEEKIYHQKLKKGLNIFEDYCDNIDQGLKTITEQIDQYIRDDE